MYLQFSWHTLRIPNQARKLQSVTRIYSSQKILIKPQVTRPDLSIQSKTIDEKDVASKSEKQFLSISNGTIAAVSNISLENLAESSQEIERKRKKWRELELDSSKLGQYYLKLSKSRLTSLVVITSMIGYAMSPSPFDAISFISCTAGTGLVSSAANSINQFLEVPFDAQMSRTRNRVLVQGHLTPLHAIGFAAAAGSVGLFILYHGANALTASLGASNLILYTTIYTPMKRISILNTWVGSVVGAIPPLMGWAACEGSLDVGALILGGILYTWQFPHFNALSWNLRPDYSKAGYRMMAVTNPGLCRRTAFRYTLGITAISSLAPVFHLTHWSFGVLSLPINLYFSYLGYKFLKEPDSKNSRKLFRFSLLHLPLLLALMLVTKEGIYSSVSLSDVKNNEERISVKDDGGDGTLKRKSSNDSKQNLSPSFPGISLSPTIHAQEIR